ncbi:WD repeat-containing protein [Cucurbitaria berberidis CBS 394.84]|uniref:DNA damage-binding protein CMR1 n=1 Tax=Cucurbitaria berberidis CBS 394.84 TaxID=1168544 RepID=A0A9P4LBL2_9PLEO|nr:WD repeat-containing protein [Cucurbitaria berberidis CBS 394.84]KAF1848299.1 WD repeat-containing protein [Cucurbitaria berberidis CBS 394.84]
MARLKNVELSEYELKRQENIAKTQALLRNLEMEAAQAGLGPTGKVKAPASTKPRSKKTAPKKIKQEDIAPRRTSSRLKGIEADSETAKRKAEEEFVAIKDADRAKRQRVSDAFDFSDIVVAGKDWNQSGNFLSNVGPANPYERTFDFDDVKETTDKELRALRERMSGLQLWEDFEPNEIKITPERIYAMGLHPTTEKPLVFAGDKLGHLGICDASQQVAEVKQEDDEDADAEGPTITTLKPHTRTIHTFQFSPHDSNALFSASYDSTVRKLDLAKGVAVEVYAPSDANEEAPLSGIEISKDDPNMLYFSTLDGRFGIYDMRTPLEKAAGLQTFQLSEKKIGGFSLHPLHPHLVATASLDRTLKIWDLRKISGKGENRAPALVGEHESRLSVSHAAWSSAGQVATASYDDTIKIHDFGNCADWSAGTSLTDSEMKPSVVVPHNNQTGRWVTILRAQWQQFPQDGLQRFCIGNMNRFVDIYTAKGQQLAQLGGDGITAVPAVAKFHPTLDWVAAGTASGKLCLWM